MNTRINYMYRDASNYKSFNTAVVGGILSETDQHAIYYCCDDDAGQRYFIPHLVGLPEKTFDDFGQYDDDHPWFEIGTAFAEVTNEPPTVDLTAEQLVKNFRAMSGRWDEAIARGQAEEQKPFPILKSQSDPNAKAKEDAVSLVKDPGIPKRIWMKASCFAPTVDIVINIPKDRDAEEYIDEYLNAILSEEVRANCEWDFN